MSGRKSRFLGALFMLIVVGGLALWWTRALTNEDPLWFLRTFKPRADWISLYWEGETQILLPGDPGYDRTMDAFARGIAHWTDYQDSVGLSNEELKSYRMEGRLLELHYSEPVRVHTYHPYPEARTFFVPLSGAHAVRCRIFAGSTDRPRVGVLTMSEEQYEILREAIRDSITFDDL